jgi:hypothetical protein
MNRDEIREKLLSIGKQVRGYKIVPVTDELLPEGIVARELSEWEGRILDNANFDIVDKEVETGGVKQVQKVRVIKPDGLHDARWIIACLVNTGNEYLLSDSDADQVKHWPTALTQKLMDACYEANGIQVGQDPVAEAVKN